MIHLPTIKGSRSQLIDTLREIKAQLGDSKAKAEIDNLITSLSNQKIKSDNDLKQKLNKIFNR